MAFNLFRIIATLAVALLVLFMGGAALSTGQELMSGGAAASEYIAPAIKLVVAVLIAVMLFWFLWAKSAVRRNLENIFSIPELLAKLGFTLGLLCIYRIGFHIPLPGLDQLRLAEMMGEASQGVWGQVLATANMFSGGNLGQSTLFGLGIMPYISASIVMQLLGTVIPALEKLQKEGPAGYKKIQEYTRYLTVALCLFQATMWMSFLRRGGYIYDEYTGSMGIFLIGVVGLTTGTLFLMWLGEQIDEYGIGQGISLLIMAGIVSRMPFAIQAFANGFNPVVATGGDGSYSWAELITLILMFLFVVAGAIFITKAQRRIPVQQAKHTRGRRVYGGQRQFLPLRINHGGVMPIIFASAIMIFPSVVFGSIAKAWPNGVTRALVAGFTQGSYVWTVCYIAMIFFFAYFWTTVQFKPKEMADQLRDHGSFIPGMRPGKRTADYLEKVMERITYCGAAFLAIIAVLPMVISEVMGIPFQISSFLGGTGLLIMVSVTLNLVESIEAQLVMRNYGGFLGEGTRMKGTR
jgi:preprotein translocase subunit SecY